MQRFLTLVSDDEGSSLRGCAIEDVVARGVRLRRADDESHSESYADILERRGLNELTVDGDSSPSRAEIGVLTSYEAAAAGVAACAERLGGLDVLVNNAGIGGPASAGAPPDKRARAMVEVNLFGAWNVTAVVIDSLVACRGRVVFVASRMAFLGLPLGAAYAVSKRGLTAYADCVRAE